MNNPTKKAQELCKDIKEQILYLQELGVENFAVELPNKLQSPTARPSVSRDRAITGEARGSFERFVPTDDLLRINPEATKPAIGQNEARRGLLEQTKLANQSEQPKRQNRGFSTVRIEETQEENPQNMKATTTSLFGDISEALPDRGESIEDIRTEIGDCTRCPLHAGRSRIVHSKGSFTADLMFVGEAPGADEDAQGEPFVGRAGKLLTKIIEGIQMKREDVLIGNINRCRPPANRQPTVEESAICKPYLLREIAVVRPKVIVVMGNTATQNLLDTKVGISKLRGNFQDYYGIKVMPTFHPAYLLRDPRKKREVWEDMKKVRDEINR